MEKLQNYYDWGFLMYGLFEDDKLVGYVSLAKQPEGHYDLNNLAVLPDKRHCAYGGRLVDFCKQKVKELGADKIRIGIYRRKLDYQKLLRIPRFCSYWN